jgi:thioredoxin 1
MPETAAVREVDVESFESEVLASDVPTLVDFYSQGCAPCRMLKPMLERLAGEYAGRVKVCAVDTTANVDLGVRFRLQAVPTLLYFRGGEVVAAGRGLVSMEVLRERMERFVAGELP